MSVSDMLIKRQDHDTLETQSIATVTKTVHLKQYVWY